MIWRRHAACVDRPASWFFPEGAAQYELARKVCQGCPVREHCLEEALRLEDPSWLFGMFGGYTPDERAQLRDDGHVSRPNRTGGPRHLVDDELVAEMLEDYYRTNGRRYGAIASVAEALDVHPNTIANSVARQRRAS